MASKADSIKLLSISTPQMRAFHLTWMAFFVCFFAWFACAPLMPVIKGEFGLSVAQLLQAMAENPKLIERPIVLANGKARLGRPPEQVKDIL